MGKKRGKTVKHARQNQTTSEGQETAFKKSPHSFVFHRGQVGKNVSELVTDMRRVMEPYTASQLQVRKKNVLKDFVSVAGVLNVSHFIIYTKTEVSVNLKICRLPRGPTLTFKLDNYALSKDIISSLKRHYMEPKQFGHHPLLVMNNFSGEGLHFKLMATMFQNMFPSISVNKVKLSEIKRCVLLNYNADTKSVDFRHYNVRAVPVGASRGVKKIIKAKVPNLSKFEDVSEFLTKGGDLSESEAELDGEHNEVTLPQKMASRGNIAQAKSAIRMTEIGPRMSLRLIKIEEGLCEGDVLYHEYIKKTNAEVKEARAIRLKKRQQKAHRKREQEANVYKKETQKEDHKKRSLAGMKQDDDDDDDDVEDPGNDDKEAQDNARGKYDVEDDIDYFKKEVGEAPDADLFPSKGKKRPSQTTDPSIGNKRGKFDKDNRNSKDSKQIGQKEKDEKRGQKDKRGKKPLTEIDRIKRRKTRKVSGKQNKNRNKSKKGQKSGKGGKTR